MVYTFPHSLPGLELAAGPFKDLTVRLDEPAQLRVRFVYERGYPDLPTLPNGDPGEPGAPDYFDFKDIITLRPLVLTEPDGVRTLIPADYDLYPRLSEAQLGAIEAAMLAEVHAMDDDLRLDRLLVPRLNVLLEGRA